MKCRRVCGVNLQPSKGVNWATGLVLVLQCRKGFRWQCVLRSNFGHLERKILQNNTDCQPTAIHFVVRSIPWQTLQCQSKIGPAAPCSLQPLSDGQCQAGLKSWSSLLHPHGCFSVASRTYRISSETKEQSLLQQCLDVISKKWPVDLKSAWKKKKMLFILSLPEHWYSQKHYFSEVFTCHWTFSLCSRVVSLMCRLN